ncbi:MAG: HupU protein [Alsobacter sp.]
MNSASRRPTSMLWLQAGSCGGCTMSILEHGAAGWHRDLAAFGIRVLWHPSVSEETGEEVSEILDRVLSGEEPLDILCLEGSVIHGPDGTGLFNRMPGTDRVMRDVVVEVAKKARYCVAVGSCAAYGGIPAGQPNPVDATGLQYRAAAPGGALPAGFRSGAGLPVINVAGCAPHPGWIVETLLAAASGMLHAEDLDTLGRPRFFADHLAHHGCSRNEFYEFKASAEKLADRGCLMEHCGCKATQAVGDCNQRGWNGEGSCTKASTCIACTSPAFQDGRDYLHTPKVAGIPVGLPLDMPKAWFVALAALSKSATPGRVRRNATADRVVLPPRRDTDGPA